MFTPNFAKLSQSISQLSYYGLWRDLMKLAINIHHVNGCCWKGGQGYSEVVCENSRPPY